ncbi:MAG: hypothetical protein GEU80_16305 [Dehalococcoidia bacterium]|nr:hypothetical protein [Dehalococcoidia bacterium]
MSTLPRSNRWSSMRQRMSRRSLLRSAGAAGVGLGGIALVGCGESEEEPGETQPAGGGGGQTPASGGGSPGAAPETSGEPVRGGTFRYAQSGEPPHLDISGVLSFGLHSPVAAIYSRLVRTVWPSEAEHRGDFTIMPDIATEWENPDLQEYVFHVRPDAHWHNLDPVSGRRVDAEDVKVALDHYRSEGAHQGAFSPVEEITTPDDSTVVVRMTEPFALFMETVSNAVRHIFAREVLDRPNGLDEAPVIGSGGFIFESFQRGDRLVATRNPDYFMPDLPYMDGYEFKFIPDAATRVANFRAGETDYLGLASWDAVQEVLETNPDAVHEEGIPGHSVFLPAMDMRSAPFDDERVRRAMSLAFDRRTLIDSLYSGHGIWGWGVPWAFAQDEVWTEEQLPWARFEPTEAKKLLDAAGQGDGFDARMNFFAYTELMESEIQLFQADMLTNLGINIQLSPMEYAGWFETYTGRNWGAEMAWGFQIGTSSTTDEFMYQNMHSTSPANYYFINDPEIDELTVRIRQTAELEERQEMVRQVHAIDQEMVYRLPSPYANGHALISPRVHGWQPPLVYRGSVGYGASALTQFWLS